MNDADFGTLLKTFRGRQHLSRDALGAISGLGNDGITNLEKGRTLPKPSALPKLAAALGLDAEERARLENAATASAVATDSAEIPASELPSSPQDPALGRPSSTSYAALLEYRQAERQWFAIIGVFVAALLATLLYLIRGSRANTRTWRLTGLLAAAGVLAGWRANRQRVRSENAREALLRCAPQTQSRNAMPVYSTADTRVQ